MFTCSRCTVRALRALLHDVPVHSQTPIVLPRVQRVQRRNAIAISQANIDRDDENLPFDDRTKELGISPVPRRHLEIESRWLNDKVKLADHIKELLWKKNEPDKALALLQLMSRARDGSTVVAWNLLLKYVLEKGQTEKAFSMYNEMKKRGQPPDSYTYLTMLKGFGITKNLVRPPSPKDISRVVGIYNSMSGPNSKVKPALIHTNAALQACSLVGDMDSIWTIISGLDEEGPNTADNITYTVLLNALRLSALKECDSQTNLATVRDQKLEAAKQGREIWLTVTKKWRRGVLAMDEQLVIAMAQLLLFSPSIDDWDDVLSLLDQTMGIERVPDPLKERNIDHIPPEQRFRRPDTALADCFQPLNPVTAKAKDKKTLHFKHATPHAGTMSVLLQACLNLRLPTQAAQYWEELIAKHKISPDLPCLNLMMRICMINRSSQTAARLLEQTLGKFKLTPAPLTLHLAMQSCVRNNKNADVVKHAAQIVDAMSSGRREFSIPILMDYLSLATMAKNGTVISRVLTHLQASVDKIAGLVKQQPHEQKTVEARPQLLVDARDFLQAFSGATDLLTKHGLVAEEHHKGWIARRAEADRVRAECNKQLIAMGDAAPLGRPSRQDLPRARRMDERQVRTADRIYAGRAENRAGERPPKSSDRSASRTSKYGGARKQETQRDGREAGSHRSAFADSPGDLGGF